MMFKNPNSKRENPFRKTYDNKDFKTVLQHKEQLPPFPYLIDVELTNCCNQKCVFCGQQAMKRSKGYMREGVLKKIVDECCQFNTPIRFIRFGEPFLHPKIIDFFKHAKSKGLLVHVTNNGLAIKEKQMKEVVDIGVDSLIFSFQGTTKEQYELLRNSNQYDELKANVLKMVETRGNKEKPFIHISNTLTNESKAEVESFIGNWGCIVDSIGFGKTNLSFLDAHQIKSLENIGKLELLKKQETLTKCYRPCTEVYQKLSVDWDGKVACCCADFDNFLVVGNINESSLSNIWNNSEELQLFRKLLSKNLHKCLTLCSACYIVYDEF